MHQRAMRRSAQVSSKRATARSKALSRSINSTLENLETRRLLSAALPAGSLDPSFNLTGHVEETFGMWSAVPGPIAVQADGKIVVTANLLSSQTDGVSLIGVARYLPDGQLDSTFSSDGMETFTQADQVGALAIRHDNDIVLFGSGGAGDTLVAIALHADGSPDNTFGDGVNHTAVVVLDRGDLLSSNAAVVDSSDNVYLAGNSDVGGFIARFAPTGLDTGFGATTPGVQTNDGLVYAYPGASDLRGIALQPTTVVGESDKLVIAGLIDPAIGYGLARIDAGTGAVDSSFGVGGAMFVPAQYIQMLGSLAQDSSGNFFVSGAYVSGYDPLTDSFSVASAVIKVSADGAQDMAYGVDGAARIDPLTDVPNPASQAAQAIGSATDSEGRLLVTGTYADQFAGTGSLFLVRFNTDGTLDSTFGTGGIVTTDPSVVDATSSTLVGGYVAVQSDGNIVVVGATDLSMSTLRYVGDAPVEPPPSDPVFIDNAGNLVVNGTSADDTIVVANVTGGLRVTLNGVVEGVFQPTGTIIVSGFEGADAVTIGSTVTVAASIDGGAGNDTLTGGAGNDSINGGDDDDVISGRNGDDSLSGGAGNDSIVGGAGNDTLLGESGNDTLRGGDGNDSLNGGDDDDQIYGNADNDTAIGGAGNDFIANDGGDDQLFGGDGNDTLNAGGGNDAVFGEAGDDSITGGIGNDSLFGGADNDTINGGAGDDYIDGGAGNDDLNGQIGSDIVLGGDGADIVQGGADRDLLIGGLGTDSVVGNADEDILIAGTTSYDNDSATLGAALATWNGADTYAARVANLSSSVLIADVTVFDDQVVDTLSGGTGTDWFLFNVDGTAIDIVDKKAVETGTDL